MYTNSTHYYLSGCVRDYIDRGDVGISFTCKIVMVSIILLLLAKMYLIYPVVVLAANVTQFD